MRLKWLYALGGLVLSTGAPAGLMLMRLWRRPREGSWIGGARRELSGDPDTYAYVAASTAAVFTAIGYALGSQADRLLALSFTDALTGLSNARGLFDRLDRALAHAKRYREPLSLLLVDLDGLKIINDRYGHHAGDEAIRSLGGVIRSTLRAADVGARWGGDEFAILAPNTPEEAALALAERIRALIPHQRAEWPLSGSIGVTTLAPGPGLESADAATLMRAADAALYEAKRRGRDMVVAAPFRQDAVRAPGAD